MKIEVTEGCICYACTIDGRDYNDFSEDELRAVAARLIARCSQAELQQLIWDTVQSIGEWEDLGSCDQCGDSIDRYTIELD